MSPPLLPKTIATRLRNLARPFAGEIALAIAWILLSAALAACFVWLIRDALANVLGNSSAAKPGQFDWLPAPWNLYWLPLAILLTTTLKAAADYAQAAIMNKVGIGIVAELQTRLFGHFVRADLAQLDQQHSGLRISPFFNDVFLLRDAAANAWVNRLRHGVTAMALFGVMVWLSPWFALAFVPVALGSSGVMRGFFRRTSATTKRQLQEASSLSAAILDNLDGIRLIKLAGREAQETARIANLIEQRQATLIRGANIRAMSAPFTDWVAGLMISVIIAFVIFRSSQNALQGPNFLAFILAAVQASQSVRQWAAQSNIIAEGEAAAERLFAHLDLQPRIVSARSAIIAPRSSGEVVFDHVCFRYRDDAMHGQIEPIALQAGATLDDISLRVDAGQTVAIVGASGSGKSTLFHLLARFYEPQSGRILVDGTPISNFTLASWRANLALVTQSPILFDDHIAANIAFERMDASITDIVAAAKAAGAHSFIEALPQGYQTYCGENGVQLSGGQKQRIAIARAFLKDSPILLLDEATSALDAQAETEIRDALERLMKDRTCLIIAHRLASIQNADRIVVLDKGRIVETGNHAELIAQSGIYAGFAALQGLRA